MQQNISILLCDDHELIISGLRQMLEPLAFVRKIELANNGSQALEKMQQTAFDVLFSDVSMPEMDGIELSRNVKKQFPSTKVIMLTQYSDMQVIKPLLKNNVDGILLKGGKSSEIAEALKMVLEGGRFYSSTIMNVIAGCFSGAAASDETLIRLSKREQQVLALIADEKTNKDISESLFISIPTVETYRSNLFRKFEVKNSAGLIRKAMQLGFIS